MRHRHQKRSSFGLKLGPRTALIRGLVHSLVEHERIKTTLPRAKEVRRRVEKAITTGKGGNEHAYRTLQSRYPRTDTVEKIINTLSKRFQTRPGGFTRIIKLGKRDGDKSEMAYLEFVDYKPIEKEVDKKEEKKLQKKNYTKRKTTKKRIRKIQQKSRKINRKK